MKAGFILANDAEFIETNKMAMKNLGSKLQLAKMCYFQKASV
jgi:hypothetical protein